MFMLLKRFIYHKDLYLIVHPYYNFLMTKKNNKRNKNELWLFQYLRKIPKIACGGSIAQMTFYEFSNLK